MMLAFMLWPKPTIVHFFTSFAELEYFSTILKRMLNEGMIKLITWKNEKKRKKLLASTKLNSYRNALTTVEKDKTWMGNEEFWYFEVCPVHSTMSMSNESGY